MTKPPKFRYHPNVQCDATLAIAPDVLLLEILSYLPKHSHLPTCHVSQHFRIVWRDLRFLTNEMTARKKRRLCHDTASCTTACKSMACTPRDDLHLSTNPVLNLFDASSTSPRNSMLLRRDLLEYYTSCGFDNLPSVLIRAAELGDLEGMTYLLDDESEKMSPARTLVNNTAICTAAAAAGQLDALMFAREVHKCPWDAARAFGEASRNGRHNVMVYIYLNSDEIPHAAGMPV